MADYERQREYMPLRNGSMGGNYGLQQLSGFQRAGNNIAAALARQPRLNAAAQEDYWKQKAMANEVGARTRLYGSQADETDAKTHGIIKQLSLVEALQTKTAPALQALAAGKTDDPTVADYVNTASALFGANKGDIVKAGRSMLTMALARGGNTAGAAAVENPVSVQNNQVNADERAARPVVVASNATLMSPGGQPLGSGGVTLNPGQKRFAATDLTGALSQPAPAVEVATGAALPPKSAATDTVRDNYIAALMKDKTLANDPKTLRARIQAFDAQTNRPGQPAAASPAPAVQTMDDGDGNDSEDPATDNDGMAKALTIQPNGKVAPAQDGPQKPTRAQARQYVSKYGKQAAAKLAADGFDVSGYAD